MAIVVTERGALPCKFDLLKKKEKRNRFSPMAGEKEKICYYVTTGSDDWIQDEREKGIYLPRPAGTGKKERMRVAVQLLGERSEAKSKKEGAVLFPAHRSGTTSLPEKSLA